MKRIRRTGATNSHNSSLRQYHDCALHDPSHDTALVDRGGGQAATVFETYGVIGVLESVSGTEFLETAKDQLEAYGTDLRRDTVTGTDRADDESDETTDVTSLPTG